MASERYALISVYDKNGIADFAKSLAGMGWKILASGGTAKVLEDSGIEVKDTVSLAGGGAILGHRVVTLSREVHAGLLARDSEEDRKELEKLNIPYIDLVCVDLYPLEEETKNPEANPESVIEKTDIGGPALLRSAAKGRRITICDVGDREAVIKWLENGEQDKENFINRLAAKAEFAVAKYCLVSARYHSKDFYGGFLGEEAARCNYGENAWQIPASLYFSGADDLMAVSRFELEEGIAPSYNNWCDLDRLLQTITHVAAGFDVNFGEAPFIAIGAKHGNPCGAAVSSDPNDALRGMIAGDTRAIFGGLVMMNFELGEEAAEILLAHLMPAGQRRLLDGIIAPSATDDAIQMLKRKGDKCRIFTNPALAKLNRDSLDHARRFRYVRGGFLKQRNYDTVIKIGDSEKIGKGDAAYERNLVLAWAVGSTSNSNTVTLVKDGQLIGNGVGQQDRVGACGLAVRRAKDAGHDTGGAVAYSDSFFPFPDGPAVLREAGIKAILASSGSVKDGEVKKYCEDKGVALYLVDDKLGRGFFGH